MNTSKLILSALGIALLATPAFAQKPRHQVTHQAAQYQSNGVVVDGRNIGADPDAQIRSELSRDGANSLGAY
jgi:hypothetical protein